MDQTSLVFGPTKTSLQNRQTIAISFRSFRSKESIIQQTIQCPVYRLFRSKEVLFSRLSTIQFICDRDLILQIKSFQKTSKIRSYFKQTIQNLSIFFYMFSIQIIFDQIPNKPFKIRSHSTDHSKPTIQVLRAYSSKHFLCI